MARIIDGEKKNLIGGNLKRLRRKHKISQQELSNKLELLGVYICRGSVSRIEDYSRTVTDIELFAIAEVLGVDVKALRAKAIYDKDAGAALRKSHENPVVKKLYDEYFDKPNSHKAHEILHTTYVKREKM